MTNSFFFVFFSDNVRCSGRALIRKSPARNLIRIQGQFIWNRAR